MCGAHEIADGGEIWPAMWNVPVGTRNATGVVSVPSAVMHLTRDLDTGG